MLQIKSVALSVLARGTVSQSSRFLVLHESIVSELCKHPLSSWLWGKCCEFQELLHEQSCLRFVLWYPGRGGGGGGGGGGTCIILLT